MARSLVTVKPLREIASEPLVPWKTNEDELAGSPAEVTVWDSGKGENGKTKTADFLSGLVGSVPPLHEIARNAGVELPEYLGRTSESGKKPPKGIDGE